MPPETEDEAQGPEDQADKEVGEQAQEEAARQREEQGGYQ